MADIAAARAHVKTLIEGGAGREDIDAYLAAEGLTKEQLRAGAVAQSVAAAPQAPVAPPPAPSTAPEPSVPWWQRQRAPAEFMGPQDQHFLSGLTLGGGDELQALGGAAIAYPFTRGGMSPPSFSDLYTGGQREIQDEMEQYAGQHPIMAHGAAITGGLMTGAAGAGRLNQATQHLGKWARGIMGYGAGVGTGATAGALEARPGERIMGAGIGGGAAAVLAPVTMAGTALGGWLGERFFKPAIQKAGERIGQALGFDDLTPEQALDAMQARARSPVSDAGPVQPSTLLSDVAPNVQRLAATASRVPGRFQREALDKGGVLMTREMGAADELIEPMSRSLISPRQIELAAGKVKLDPSRNFFTTRENLMELREAAASELYEKAWATSIVTTPRLKEFLARSKPLKKALKELDERAEARSLLENRKVIARTEGLDEEPELTLEGWDVVKEIIDDMAAKTKAPRKAYQLRELKRQILDELDPQAPAYKEARATWQGTKHFEETMGQGRKALNMSADELEWTLNRMEDVDKVGFRLGMANELKKMVEAGGLTHDVAQKFNTQAMQRKLRDVFPDLESYNDFMKTVDRLSSEHETYRRIKPTTGSDTFGLFSSAGLDPAETVMELGADMWSGQTGNAMRRGMSWLGGDDRLTPAISEHIGDIVQNPRLTFDELSRFVTPPPPRAWPFGASIYTGQATGGLVE